VNDYVPFFGVPAPPPTDRKILEKTETDRAEIFGEKIWKQNANIHRQG
jgi:hypothetical protein